jgi:hypothetical protein
MNCWSCRKKKENNYTEILNKLDLEDFQKIIIRLRYIDILDMLHKRTTRITISYYFNKIIVTIGSLIVPALLSIQYTNTGPGQDARSFSFQIYWSTWVLSLLVSICNGLMSIFRVEKKYIYLHSDIEFLTSEGWQYAGLTGRYSGFFTPGQEPSHKNQFKFFCHITEKIMMKEVEAEFSNKLEQSAAHQASANKTTNVDSRQPLTPFHPEEIQAIRGMLQDARTQENTLGNQIGNGSATEQPNSSGENTNTESTNTTPTRRQSQTSENSEVSVRVNMQETTRS